MTPKTFAGIQRYTLFSPNHVGNDASIFSAVAKHLVDAGHTVNMYTEQNFLTTPLKEKYVFTMMRSKAAVRNLQKLEKQGVVAVNSAFGIENCTRERMTDLLIANKIPHPKSLTWNTNEIIPEQLIAGTTFEHCWVKRADFHAIHREDVTYIRTYAELKEVIAEYALRGIDRVVINEHLKGDLVKFYGVAGTGFFHWFYPYNGQHSKFGLEEINGTPVGITFSESGLKRLCDEAARVLKVQVYGGDCIVAPDGSIRIIDFNDWPSFAPCRDEASKAIAQVILQESERAEITNYQCNEQNR